MLLGVRCLSAFRVLKTGATVAFGATAGEATLRIDVQTYDVADDVSAHMRCSNNTRIPITVVLTWTHVIGNDGCRNRLEVTGRVAEDLEW